jgi:AraC-like DNA-binding protein
MRPTTVAPGTPMIAATTDFLRRHPEGIRHVVEGHWSVVLVTEGRGVMEYGPESATVEAGDALAFPPGAQQNFRPVGGNLKHVWVTFEEHVDLLPLLHWPALPVGEGRRVHVPDGPVRGKVCAAFEELREAFGRFAPPKRMDLCFLCVRKILLWLDAANPLTTPAASDPRVMKATAYMQTNLDEKITVAHLAGQVSLSADRFAHLFKEVTGTTPIRYLRRLRMEKACLLLETTPATLAEIAAQVGYCNEFHFGNSFKKVIGVSPGEYRKQKGQGYGG